jgi:hypothetical protein
MARPAPSQVVVRSIGGEIVKGYTDDFDPDQPSFHLVPASDSGDEPIEVPLKGLKAVFFVRSFAGNPQYVERKAVFDEPRPEGRKVMVEFSDGEVLVGYTAGYKPQEGGLFVVPVDPRSNNVKVYAVLAAVTRVNLLSW